MNALLDHDFETGRRRRRLSFSQALRFLPLSWGKKRRFEKRRAAARAAKAGAVPKPAPAAIMPWTAQGVRRV